MATGRIVPHPPPGPRPDHLPLHRPGTRYVRPNSLPPLEGNFATVSGISRITKPRCSSGTNPARHTAKSRARAAFLEGERAKFDERFPPLRHDAPAHGVLVEKPLVGRPVRIQFKRRYITAEILGGRGCCMLSQ